VLGPPLKSCRLGLVQKSAAVLELTMPTLTSLTFSYLVLFTLNLDCIISLSRKVNIILAGDSR
jgi:hypothetical protein